MRADHEVTGPAATGRTAAEDDVFGPRRTRGLARWRAILLALAVLAVAVFAAWWGSREPAPQAEVAEHAHGAAPTLAVAQPVMLSAEQARRIGVTYATVERGTLAQEIRAVAQVVYDETRVRTVSLKFDGWAERLFVDFTGQLVRAGEPLLSTYSPMLVSAQEELALASRLVRDVAGSDSTTRHGAQQMRMSARQRLLNWDVPEAQVDRVDGGGEILKTLEIRAAYDGVVVEKFVLEGQRFMAGDALYRIADLSTVWVEGEVFEQDLALIRLGQSVDIDIEALPGQPRRGRIVFLQPTVSSDTRTTRLRVELANGDGRLRPGLYATVRIDAGSMMPVLHVPRSAVLSTGRRDIVFVRRADGMLEPREIVRGLATDTRVSIVSGLTVGETVVASATFLIDAESNLGSAIGGMAGMPVKDPDNRDN